MQSATLDGSGHDRSGAEQIEYWTMLGRQVADDLDPDKLLDVLSGLTAVRVEPVSTAAVAPEQVFRALEQQRRSGQLGGAVSSALLRYQTATTHPRFPEEITSDGKRRLGESWRRGEKSLACRDSSLGKGSITTEYL